MEKRTTLLYDALKALSLVALMGLQHPALLLPGLAEVPVWDQTWYVEQGRLLYEQGLLPRLCCAPLLAVLHAGACAAFHTVPGWLAACVTTERILLAVLLVFMLLRLLKHFGLPGRGWIALLLIVQFPAFRLLLVNGSDSLYTLCASAGLLSILHYSRTQRRDVLVAGGFAVGLAALARLDGLILSVVFLFLIVRVTQPGRRARAAAIAVLPVLMLTAAVFLVSGAQREHRFGIGAGWRTYSAFRQAEANVFTERYTDPARAEAASDSLYGTERENGGSVARAIARNPGAYLGRQLHQIVYRLPTHATDAYGPLVLILLLLAGRGAIELWRGTRRRELAILLLWLLPWTAYTLTFIRAGYLTHALCILFVPAAIGARALLHASKARRSGEILFWSAAGIAAVLIGVFSDSPSALAGGIVLTLAPPLVAWFRDAGGRVRLAGAGLVVAVLLLPGGMQPALLLERIGGAAPQDETEQLVEILAASFPKDASIAAAEPLVPCAARLRWVQFPTLMDSASAAEWFATARADGALFPRHGAQALSFSPSYMRVTETENYMIVRRHDAQREAGRGLPKPEPGMEK